MSVVSKERLIAKLEKKAYREAYVIEHVKTSVPLQIGHLREQRGWTQAELAERAKTTQTVISRLEDPNYGNLSLNSLLKIAAAFDIGLLVKFVPFHRLLAEFQDFSPTALSAPSFPEELALLKQWAGQEETSSAQFLRPAPVMSAALTQKALGRDRQQSEDPQPVFSVPPRTNVIPFPTERIFQARQDNETRTTIHEALSNLTRSAHSAYGSERMESTRASVRA